MLTLPSPAPVPQPGGGAPGSYEYEFNLAYIKSRRTELQPFFFGMAGQPGDALSQPDKNALADELYAAKIPFDEQIEMQSSTNEAYGTMFSRAVIYGYKRVRVGTGTAPIQGVVDPEELRVPWDPSMEGVWLPVSIDIADFPPFKA